MFEKNKKTIIKNPRLHTPLQYWTWLVGIFFLFLTGALLFSSWLFLEITRSLDAEVLPTFETNAVRIRNINTSVTATEAAIHSRTAKDEIVVSE